MSVNLMELPNCVTNLCIHAVPTRSASYSGTTLAPRIRIPYEADVAAYPTGQVDSQRRSQFLAILHYSADADELSTANVYHEPIEITRYHHDIYGCIDKISKDKRGAVKKIGSGALAGLPLELTYDKNATRVFPDYFARHVGRRYSYALSTVHSIPFMPHEGMHLHAVLSPETIRHLQKQHKKRT